MALTTGRNLHLQIARQVKTFPRNIVFIRFKNISHHLRFITSADILFMVTFSYFFTEG